MIDFCTSTFSHTCLRTSWTISGSEISDHISLKANRELEATSREKIQVFINEHFASFVEKAREMPHGVYVARKGETHLSHTIRFRVTEKDSLEIQLVLRQKRQGSRNIFGLVALVSQASTILIGEIAQKKQSDIEYLIGKTRQTSLEEEIKLLTQLSPYVPFLPTYRPFSYVSKDGSERTKYLTDVGVDLLYYLNENALYGAPLVERQKIILQLAEALCALHQKNICHLDIKADNIILHPDGSIRLCDFGLAARFAEKTPPRGSIGGRPPEMYDTDVVEISASMDMWPFGLLCYSILHTLSDPFYDIQKRIRDAPTVEARAAKISLFKESLADLRLSLIHQGGALNSMIAHLLSPIQKNRPTAEQVLESLKRFFGKT